MRITLSSVLAVTASVAFEQVKRPALLHYVAYPLIRFVPDQPFPEVWQSGRYETKMQLFGVIPLGRQTIGIEQPDATVSGSLILRDKGSGHLARTWDHWIYLKPLGEEQCQYTDRVTIQAGVLTPFIGFFALIFYAWRQHRWKKLVRLNFKPIDH